MTNKFIKEDVLIMLSELDYNQVVELERWCRDAARYDGARYQRHAAKMQQEQAAAVARREKEIRVAEEIYPKQLKWLKDNLKPGTVLKMRGCKDGIGLREFIRWDSYNDLLICWQIHRRYDSRTKTWTNVTGNQVTTHMADKVTQVHINGTPFPIKSLFN